MIRKLFAVVIGLILLNCSNSVSPETEIYSNSFEKETDFDGWNGITTQSWNDDVPFSASKHSISISGGCVVPHAYYIFENNIDNGYYTIECWGKAFPGTFGGGVSLKYYNDDEEIQDNSVYINFSDSVWTHKISDTLFFDNSADLRIEMTAGGFIPSGMLIDELVVKRLSN